MGARIHMFACILGLTALGSCAPIGSVGGSGICKTADSGKDTYQIFGQWKKVTPYKPSKSEDELKLNFDLMIIESGVAMGTDQAAMCAARVINSGISSVVYRAAYAHDVPGKKMTITYKEGTGAGSTVKATYSFSGSCNDTKLTLTYGSGSQEVYQFFSSDGTPGNCSPATE